MPLSHISERKQPPELVSKTIQKKKHNCNTGNFEMIRIEKAPNPFLQASSLVLLSVSLEMSRNTALAGVCEEALKLVEKYQALPNDTDLIASTKLNIVKSLEILDQALSRFQNNELAISYNGGKDCLVMLILFLAQIHEHFKGNPPFKSILTVLIHDEEQFPELLEFIKESSERYNLNLVRYDNSLKEGFRKFLDKHPSTQAVIVGVRRSDPYSSTLDYFNQTDNDWPSFIRVNPVLDWNYEQVWSFLKELKIPYCKLYDMGYTSIGGVTTTLRNPHLLDKNGEYSPAFKLAGVGSDEVERDGRFARKK